MYKMFVFYFLVMCMYNFTAPVTPEMLIDKEVFSGLNSFLVAIFSLAIFLTSPIASKYINLNGLKKVMIIVPLLMAMSQFIMFVSPGSFGLLLGRGLTGFFGAFFFLAGSIYVNNFSDPNKKAKNFAYLMVASSLGGVVGQTLVGNLSIFFEGYAFAFILQIILALALIIPGIFMIKEIDYKSTIEDKKSEKFKISPILLLVGLLAASFIIYSANIGYYFMDQLGADTNQVAIINSLYLVILLFSNLFIVQIVEKYFSLNKLFVMQIAGALISMIFLIVSINLSSTLLIFISLIVFIFSLSIFLPLAQKFVVSNNAKDSNKELGFINSSYSLGMVIGSIIGGITYSINPNLIFISIVVTLLIALFVHLSQIKKVKQV